jgi:hypothetical protein
LLINRAYRAYRARIAFFCVAAFAMTAGGCANRAQLFEGGNEGGLFSQSFNFTRPEWSLGSERKTAELGPTGPVAAEDLVNPDGSCAVTAQAAQNAAPAVEGATPPTPTGDAPGVPPAPQAADPGNEPAPVLGGVALGMSECEVARHAGAPNNVSIGTGDQGERKVVLTYLGDTWPGIYTFSAGRLKVVDAVPEPEKPKKPEKKKKVSRKRVKNNAPQAKPRVLVQ